MATIDIIIVILLVPAVFQGLTKGFMSQAIALVSVIAGAWLAFHFSEKICGFIAPYLGEISPTVLHIVGFVLIFTLVVFLLYLVGGLLKKIIKFAMLGWIDKLLGIILALLKISFVIGILIILFNSLNNTYGWVDEAKLSESILYGPFKDAAYKVFPYLKALLFKNV